ncbi:fasciclin domain-containing protein [Nonomuraea sp. NPDC059194]|uniref:fasciclin domain-containing protein n=1 Tax=Nonomuraea sp. NPDC059194 TaxID=3346764 RepID=UPI003677AD3B
MRYAGVLAISVTTLILVTGCGSGSTAGMAMTGAAPTTSQPAPATTAGMADGPFGPACSAVPAQGEGSFTGMADDPVATAAGHNPALATLVTAVKKAGLVDTLNSAEDVTVFAPTNDAFAAIPKETLDKVLADKAALTKILTYHVVKGKKAPADLADAKLVTLQGGELTVTGSGEDYTVNGAKVVCGNVPTANATVYIIDKVLMPE